MEAFATRRAMDDRAHTAARALVVGALYGLTAWLGAEIAIDDQFTPIWLPAGIALVATLRWGPWMAVAAGIAETLVSLSFDVPLGVALTLGVGNGLEPLIAAAILHRLGMRGAIRRVRDAFVLLLAIVVAATASASIAVGAFLLADVFTLDDAARQWPIFWASVVLAVMLVAPFALAVMDGSDRIERTRTRILEAAIVFVLVGVTSAYVLDGAHVYATVILYPLFVWSALRFGVVGAAGSILFAAAVAVAYELTDPASLPGVGLNRSESVLAVQAMLATAAVGNLVLATLLVERDASRRQLERSARALEEAQEIARLGSWEWTERGGVSHLSTQMRSLFGIAPDARDIVAILDQVPEEERAELERLISRTIAEGGEFAIEHRVERGGEDRIVLHAGRVTHSADTSQGRIVATALDITERTAIDRLREALVATASHELRTPLTSLVGFADTLVEHWDRFSDERRLEFLSIIRAQGRRLSMVVDDTLMQSRLDAGSVVVADDPYPVINAIIDAVQLARVEPVEVRCDTSLVAVGSHEHLTQIVVNFLTNAAKYGAPPFVIDVRRGSADDLEVRVIDHGPGVDPAFRERLFERFARGPGTDRQPGTGLGMSIVRGLAAANGGRAWYERDRDRTIFACTVRSWSHEPATR